MRYYVLTGEAESSDTSSCHAENPETALEKLFDLGAGARPVLRRAEDLADEPCELFLFEFADHGKEMEIKNAYCVLEE